MTVIRHRKWFLLSLAALGAAGMFLGSGEWRGIEVGHVGSAVLYAALWMFVMHLSRHSQAVFPESSSPAERQAWVAAAFVALIAFHFGYFLLALPDLGAEADQISNSMSRPFGINLGMLIFAWIVVGRVVRSHELMMGTIAALVLAPQLLGLLIAKVFTENVYALALYARERA